MQRIAAVLTGKEMDSRYFELYIESLYQTAKFLNESDDSPAEGPVIDLSHLLHLPTASLVQQEGSQAIRTSKRQLTPRAGRFNPHRSALLAFNFGTI